MIFRGKYYFLSNMYPCTIRYCGLTYTSAESAFQAQKTENESLRRMFARGGRWQSAPDAKRAGRREVRPLRPGWDSMKEEVMLGILREKFKDRELADLLLMTGTDEITEENCWGDRYWGVCGGKGKNRLGVLLMQVRSELRAEKENAAPEN